LSIPELSPAIRITGTYLPISPTKYRPRFVDKQKYADLIFPSRLSRWLSAFVAAWLGLRLLQSKESAAFKDTVPVKSDTPPGVTTKTVKYAGRTLDLTLFAVTRALDVIVGELWYLRRSRRLKENKWTKVCLILFIISQLSRDPFFAHRQFAG
jgi:hypothetical protein